MSLIFYGHPLSSFCWKALIALYQNETPFRWKVVDLADPVSRADFEAIWPIAKMPVLLDDARAETLPEASIIIEYLDLHYPGRTRFVPEDPDLARKVRFWDRVCDNYLQAPMQKIVIDRLRPAGQRDPHGVEEARAMLATTLAYLERRLHRGPWLAGDQVSLADCGAAPALYYSRKVLPSFDTYPLVGLFLDRLMGWEAFARVLKEAEPHFQNFPSE